MHATRPSQPKRSVERLFRRPWSEVVRDLHASGEFTNDQIAASLKVHRATLYRWLREIDSQPQPAPAAEDRLEASA